MAYPGRTHPVPVWVNPPPPGAEEYTPSIAIQPTNYLPAGPAGFYSGHNNINVYNCTSNASYYSKENDYNAHDRFNANQPSGSSESRYSKRSETPSPQRQLKARYSDKTSKERGRDRYSPEHSRSRYTSRRRSPSRDRRRSRSNSRYRRNRSRSTSRRRYRRSRSSSRGKYSTRRRRSRSNSRTRTYNSRNRKSSRSRSMSRSSNRSYSRLASPESSASSSPEDNNILESVSLTSESSHISSNQLKGFDSLSHKQFINRKAQEYTNKTQQNLHDASNTFKNDGSFLEMFKKLQEEKEKKVDDEKDNDKPEKILNIVAAANSLLESAKPPTLPVVSKRRGGRILKTGVVEKKRTVVQEEQPKDAWAVYMKEVKRYKEACCDDDSKTRPLVK